MTVKKRETNEPEIYSETVDALFGYGVGAKVAEIVGILLVLTFFAVALVYRSYLGNTMAFLMGFTLLITLIILIRRAFKWGQLYKYRISITSKSIAVSYDGACKAVIHREDIADCYRDNASLDANFYTAKIGKYRWRGVYRGDKNSGIWLAKMIDDNSRLYYIQAFGPRVALRLKKAYDEGMFGIRFSEVMMGCSDVIKDQLFNEFVFSTKNPDAVMGVIKKHISDSQ